MADSKGLAELATTELDVVTTAATTVYLAVIVDDIPKRITLADLIAVIGGEISILDLSDTPSAFSASDTWKTNAGADAVEQVTV